MTTTIYLVRHGESLGNQARVMLGHTDLDLSPLGYAQAEKTCEALSCVPFCAIYSSDLKRAYNTALPHARLRGMQVIPRAELREMYVGEWENRSVDDIIENYGDLFLDGWRKRFGVFTTPGGEPVDSVRSRFCNAIIDIARAHPGGTVLVAAHAAVIRLLWGLINSVEPGDLASTYPYP